MQGSSVHAVKKFHRNVEGDAADNKVSVGVETDQVTAKDEFWDYEKQVCLSIIDEDKLFSFCFLFKVRSYYECWWFTIMRLMSQLQKFGTVFLRVISKTILQNGILCLAVYNCSA